jgi:hypothetical protein
MSEAINKKISHKFMEFNWTAIFLYHINIAVTQEIPQVSREYDNVIIYVCCYNYLHVR